jgi:hypothetical protein
MHKLALAEEIVAASLQAINTHGGGRLERVHVVVGERNHIDPDILSDAFTMAAAAAVLNVETPPNLCAASDVDFMGPNATAAVTAIEVADETWAGLQRQSVGRLAHGFEQSLAKLRRIVMPGSPEASGWN